MYICVAPTLRKYGLTLTRTFPFKEIIYDSVLIRENTSQREPVFFHIIFDYIYSIIGLCSIQV